ncbi:hypothetical protein [Sneathiella aquimaris]|uniref:hypothetical protein n=1 Tax=Sneathiella aquimaris TaxID=2599305 RepID=UPI00146D5F4A|nr:hypothetical protein [Sneathiella aquimaris]
MKKYAFYLQSINIHPHTDIRYDVVKCAQNKQQFFSVVEKRYLGNPNENNFEERIISHEDRPEKPVLFRNEAFARSHILNLLTKEVFQTKLVTRNINQLFRLILFPEDRISPKDDQYQDLLGLPTELLQNRKNIPILQLSLFYQILKTLSSETTEMMKYLDNDVKELFCSQDLINGAPIKLMAIRACYPNLTGSVTYFSNLATKSLTDEDKCQIKENRDIRAVEMENRLEELRKTDQFYKDEALKLSQSITPPDISQIHLIPETDIADFQINQSRHLQQLHATLRERPDLLHVLTQTGPFVTLWIRCLENESDDIQIWKEWNKYGKQDTKRKIFERAHFADIHRIPILSRGHLINLNSIRARLKDIYTSDPMRDKITHEERQILATALGQNITIVRIGGKVFQYLPGENMWVRKEFGVPDSSGYGSSSRLWQEGKIISRNYGSTIILPYINSDNIHVHGHTRNKAYEGPAKLRKEPVELSWRSYQMNNKTDTWSVVEDDVYYAELFNTA